MLSHSLATDLHRRACLLPLHGAIAIAPIVSHLDFGGHVGQGEAVYWFAILVAINLQTSFLTPPFGFALFYLKGTARSLVSLQQIYRGIIPFVLLQLLALAVVVMWPDVAMWLPNQMFD